MRNYYAFCPPDTSCENYIGITRILVVLYVDFQSAEKVRSPCICFTTNMLQKKELLSQKQWHLKIGYTYRPVSFINGISCYHSEGKLWPEERDECKKTLTGPALNEVGNFGTYRKQADTEFSPLSTKLNIKLLPSSYFNSFMKQ